jgi:hypothetical protein
VSPAIFCHLSFLYLWTIIAITMSAADAVAGDPKPIVLAGEGYEGGDHEGAYYKCVE